MSDATHTNPLALIVEDDETSATIFAQAMQMANYNSQIVTDGQEALETLAHTTPDLVILDMHLPQVSGEDVLAYIRSTDRLQDICVIVATADASIPLHLKHKANLILLKPVSFHQLRTLSQRFQP